MRVNGFSFRVTSTRLKSFAEKKYLKTIGHQCIETYASSHTHILGIYSKWGEERELGSKNVLLIGIRS